MANTIITKNSSTASAVPTSGDLVQGELAVNVTDKRLFTENSGGTVVEVGTNPSTMAVAGNATVGGTLGVTGLATLASSTLTANPTLTSGTANGVTYLNGSKVLTSGSALTFDGTNLGLGAASVAAKLHAQSAVGNNGADNTGMLLVESTFASSAGNSNASIVAKNFYGNLQFMQWQNFGARIGSRVTANGGAGEVAFTVGNDSEAMRLTSTGSVGIGTSSPPSYGATFTVVQASNSGSGVVQAHNSTNSVITEIESEGTRGAVGTRSNHDLAFKTNQTVKMRLDSAGNLGLGVTPSGWRSIDKAFDVGDTISLYYQAGDLGGITHNHYFSNSSGNRVYKKNGYANMYLIGNNGAHAWFNAPSGTAGTAISFTQAMTLTAAGNLGIGTSSPIEKLTIANTSGAAAAAAFWANGGNSSNELYVGQGGDNEAYVFNRANTALVFGTNNLQRMRIDSSGNLLVGATSGSNRLTVSSSANDYISRMYNTNATGSDMLYMQSTADPNNTTYKTIYTLNNATARFYVQSNGGIGNYQANNVNLSDLREKTNFAPAKSYLETICAIPVQTFNYIDQNMEDDGGLTLGVVAQDVQAVAPELVMESNWGTVDEPKMRLSVYQTDLQYALMKCIQEQQAIIESLTARVSALEGN